jgi:hypothetical protein
MTTYVELSAFTICILVALGNIEVNCAISSCVGVLVFGVSLSLWLAVTVSGILLGSSRLAPLFWSDEPVPARAEPLPRLVGRADIGRYPGSIEPMIGRKMAANLFTQLGRRYDLKGSISER